MQYKTILMKNCKELKKYNEVLRRRYKEFNTCS